MTDLKTPTEARRAGAGIAPSIFHPAYPFYPEEQTFDLFEIGRAIYRERYWVVGITFVAIVLALAASFTIKPVYRAEVLMSPVVTGRNDGVGSLISQLGDLGSVFEGYVSGGKDRTAESIATLRSRSLAMEFIRQQDIKPQLFPALWDGEQRQWRSTGPTPTDLEAYEVFDAMRSVEVDRRTGLVLLAIEWRDPTQAAHWANALVRQANDRRRIEAIREARQSVEYLQQQAAKTASVEVLQAIYRLIEAHTKTMAIANAREDYAFKVIDRALPPESHIRPKREIMIATGLVFGLIVAVGVVLLRDALRRRQLFAK